MQYIYSNKYTNKRGGKKHNGIEFTAYFIDCTDYLYLNCVIYAHIECKLQVIASAVVISFAFVCGHFGFAIKDLCFSLLYLVIRS